MIRAYGIYRQGECYSSPLPPHNNNAVSSFLGGRLTINYAAHEVFLSEKKVKLTPIEYKILCQLATNQGAVVNNTDLLHRVWGPNYESDNELVKGSIHRLRHKMEDNPAIPEMILNERGVGYILRCSDSRQRPL
ncbi:MAG: hypothetical protein CO103_03865 [Chloroflexi bacterium CG_4_9_14_3_um_filter_45_9]|nr:MAG: hypothetical protein COT13_00795 [Chloroflexi bacterium CG08_land_8_20_14_0_20_45_12]PIX27085.1 MAG: hypothetical protein COZ67_04195 [Chloroflexi bacterium CG_4_8_14_3_um_filter_45_15]PJB49886.1 MAG: hypothetical protein CO103_03865 [Chloroflexi bacterium CG_4_9_14_3_um_filter_45_9]